MIRLENVLKISFQDVFKNSWTRFEDVLGRRLKNVLKTSLERLEDVLKTFLQDVLKRKTSWKRLEDLLARRLKYVFKASSRHLEDVWPRRIFWSWARRLEDFLWRRRRKTSSSRRVFGEWWQVHFVLTILFVLTLTSDMAVIYGNDAFSVLVLSTKKRCSSFLKKVFFFQKICFKVKLLKTFKISTDCHVKVRWSLKQGAILKFSSIIFHRNLCCFCLL